MDFQTVSDWCKWLEKNFSPEVMIPTLPVVIRLDGNNFSSWTKKLNKPYDYGLSDLMICTTKYLVKETNAIVGYTQSDEITLILYSDDRKSSIYNDGKKQKILSKLTGSCVSFFNSNRPQFVPNQNKIANFDCRIYQTPTLHDACVQLLWRENDAVRNSIFMLAQSMFSCAELFQVNSSQAQDMMMSKGVNWNNVETRFKRGTYVKRIKTSKPFSQDEIDLLPAKHLARMNPELVIERSIIKEIEYPIFSKITNQVDVIFNDLEPIIL